MHELPLMSYRSLFLASVIVSVSGTPLLSGQEIPRTEYAGRRAHAMSQLDDGILLLHARTAEKAMEQWGFVQDGTFQYFSGLLDLPGAVLAMDGPRGEAHLFLPPPQRSFGQEVSDFGIGLGPDEATAHELASVRDWSAFVPWVEARLAAGVQRLYLDGSRRPEANGAPPGMRAVAGDRTLWRAAVEEAFPAAEIASARESIQRIRWAKSVAEIAVLSANAARTVTALAAVATEIEDGITQRHAEAAVVASCLREGGQGPSFWPWTMSGPNAHTGRLVQAFFRYDQLDRVMRSGELVRVDIGCAGGGYGADVGRTFPVSGRFTPGQKEVWDLLVAGYRVGLGAMRAGVALDAVRAASVDAITERVAGLRTEQGRAAADLLLSRGLSVWHIHGIGIESGEEAVDPLVAGAVIAYEPTLEVGPDAYYLEDMIEVTGTGHRILSADLPYSADEIEAWMKRGR